MDDAIMDEKKSTSRYWLDELQRAQDYFGKYFDVCEKLKKQYASLKNLSGAANDTEMQIFWANLEVMKPSIYSRAPVPLVDTKHGNTGGGLREAAEILERSIAGAMEGANVHGAAIQLRDRLALTGRAVAWVVYDGDGLTVEALAQRDFLHNQAECWDDVEWVARRAYLTEEEGVARFGDVFRTIEARKKQENEAIDWKEENPKKAIWEIWHKGKNKVVWVAQGLDHVLDESEPPLDLEGFFPCPEPVYTTREPDSLLPVPDQLFYRDQLDDINRMTARISALSNALRMVGFYASGTDLGESIEKAFNNLSDRQMLVPVPDSAALAAGGIAASVSWMPVQEVANTITQCILIRRQLIDDVYQVSGLSDVMRGATNPNETLGAQQLKSQYGSVRIKDRVQGMVRMCADIAKMVGEILSENASIEELANWSQMVEMPREAQIERQVQMIFAQANRQAEQAVMQGGDASQIMQQAQAKAAQLRQTVTFERAVGILRQGRMRPFLLEIETDSTIQPDEQAAKQRASEFIGAVGGFMAQMGPLVQGEPRMAKLAGSLLKDMAQAFRISRSTSQAIDEFIKVMEQPTPPAPNPRVELEKAKQAREDKKVQIEEAKAKAEIGETVADTEKTKAETMRILNGPRAVM